MDDELQSFIPVPPHPLSSPNIDSLAIGEILHRVHDRKLVGNNFNPCKGSKTRFSPLYNDFGQCIPTLYAANTEEAAIYETVFHDIPLDAAKKIIPRSMVELRNHSVLQLRRDLRLARLHAPDLRQWRISREQLIGSLPTQYQYTVQWARAIHTHFHDVDGLVWTSNLCDPDMAYLLFGDRVLESDIEVIAVREGRDQSFLNAVHSAGARGGILISL